MRAPRHYHQRQLAFEQLESRSMLSASSLKTSPVPHSYVTHLVAAVSSPKTLQSYGTAAAKVASAAASPAIVTPTPGDLNFDGKINAADFPDMLLALTNPTAYEQKYNINDEQLAIVADVNQNGFVSNSDLQALLHLIATQPPDEPPPPPPPPQPAQLPITPTEQTVAPVIVVVSADNITTVTAAPVVTSAAPTSGPAGFFIRPQSTEALLAGGAGDAQAAPAVVASNAPPMPTHARSGDVALIAFTADARGGGDQLIEGMLLNLADVEEPQMLAIEYGDDVVKHEVVVNKAVVPSPIEQPTGADSTTAEQTAATTQPQIVAETAPPLIERSIAAPAWQTYWWIIPAGVAASIATWWTYRQRLLGNVGTLLRRLGL